MLEAGGFEVIDLGIDVPPEKVVEVAKQENIKIIALSGVLTLALDSMKNTINAFADAGMRDDVKIIIGGNPVSEEGLQGTGSRRMGIQSAEDCSGMCKLGKCSIRNNRGETAV